MATHENGPPLDGWMVEAKACPIPCVLCMADELVIGDNIVLGDE